MSAEMGSRLTTQRKVNNKTNIFLMTNDMTDDLTTCLTNTRQNGIGWAADVLLQGGGDASHNRM